MEQSGYISEWQNREKAQIQLYGAERVGDDRG